MNIEKFNEFLAGYKPYNDIYYNVNGDCVELNCIILKRKDYAAIQTAYEVATDGKQKYEDIKTAVDLYAKEHKKEFDTEVLINEAITKDLLVSKLQYCAQTGAIYYNGKDVSHNINKYVLRIMGVLFVKQTHISSTECEQFITEYAKQHPYTLPNAPIFEDWAEELEMDDAKPVKCAYNVRIYLTRHPNYAGKFAYNEFTCVEEYDGAPITDAVIARLREDIELVLKISSKDIIIDGICNACRDNSYHPFKDRVSSLMWDQQPRMETLFIKFLGVEDTSLNRSITKKWFYAAIKRLFEPGCQYDNMPIICDSTQGTGKSKLIERLVTCLGFKYGFDSTISTESGNKDNIDKMNHCWIGLIDELSSFIKSNSEAAKQFLSQTSDNTRLAYARRTQTFYRHTIFIATTNSSSFLKDYDSKIERRYQIMVANGTPHSADWWKKELPDNYLLQVWAEAYHLYITEPEFEYATLSLSELEELGIIQKDYKTANADAVLAEKTKELVDRIYTTNVFDTYCKFSSSVNSFYTPQFDVAQQFISENELF